MNRSLLVAITLFFALALPFAGRADSPVPCSEPRPPGLDRAGAFIRTRAELEAWLAVRPAAAVVDPLGALSPPARTRFLASLRFGPNGVAAFQSKDIQSELTTTQAWRLLALFGLQSALAAMPGLAVRSPEDAEVDAWRRGVSFAEAP
jgi:hypothetical protein